MEVIQFKECEVILFEEGINAGKVIISTSQDWNFSYQWGGQRGKLKEFLITVNAEYFTRNLCSYPKSIDAKASVSNIRNSIKTELKYELPWYKHMGFQKHFRQKLKEVESVQSQEEFVHAIQNIVKYLDYQLADDDHSGLQSTIEGFFTEPWNFIETKDSPQAIYLHNLFPKLQTEIKKLLV